MSRPPTILHSPTKDDRSEGVSQAHKPEEGDSNGG